MRLTLFGAPALQLADGPAHALPWQRPTALLAIVACHGDGIGRDAMATLLRPDADEATARAHLRRNLHRARALLPEPDALQADDRRIDWRAGCDVREFLAAADARDWPRAAALHAAPLLAGCGALGDEAIDRWLDAQRDALAARLRVVLCACLDRPNGDDDGERAGWIERLLALDPFDESAWQLVLHAARGPASRAAALAGVERGIAAAREQLGVAPLPQTLALRDALAGAARAPAAPAAAAPAPSLDGMLGAGPLLGRDALLAALAERLAAERWVTLTGVGGVGKTRLALAAAHAWAERHGGPVVRVDLSALEAGGDIGGVIARAAGLDAGASLAEWIAQTLPSQPGLLLLDNLEHLADDPAAHDWPRRWLAAGDRSALLATSRRPLGLELAASWLPVMRPAEILAEVERGLAFLVDDEAQPPSHRSLRAVFARSWLMLAPALQSVLAALTVLHERFDLDAAREVALARPADLLRLAGQSLVQRGSDGRFALHPVVRRFAAQTLDAAQRAALQARHAEHFARRLATLPGLGPGRADPPAVQWLLETRADLRAAWLHACERRRLDLLAALHERLAGLMSTPAWAREMAALWSRAIEAVPADEPLHASLQVAYAGALATAGEVAQAAEAIGRTQPHGAGDRSSAATVRAIVARWRGDAAAVEQATQDALEAAQAAGEVYLEARALQNRAVHLWSSGRSDEAEPLVLRMLALADAHDANLVRARALRLLSTLRQGQGRRDEAEALLARSTEAFGAVPEPYEVAFNERNAAYNARLRGDTAALRRHAQASMATMRRLGLVEAEQRSRLVLALADLDEGRLADAERHLAEVLRCALRLGQRPLQRRAALQLAITALRQGHGTAAVLLARLLDEPGLPDDERQQGQQALAASGDAPADANLPLEEVCAALLALSRVPG